MSAYETETAGVGHPTRDRKAGPEVVQAFRPASVAGLKARTATVENAHEAVGRSRVCFVAIALAAAPAAAQAPDTILVNGKILTVDAQFSTREAMAIRDGRIVALGSIGRHPEDSPVRRRASSICRAAPSFPGLIDSHLHAIRAAQTFSTEVNWIGAPSLTEALGRISEAARTMKPGAWLIVAGGWNVQQFKENRRPTQAELVAAAPNNPVYVQLGYGWAMLTPAGLQGAEHHERRRRAVRRQDWKRTRAASRPAASAAARARSSRCSTSCRSRPSTSRSTARRNSSASSIASR